MKRISAVALGIFILFFLSSCSNKTAEDITLKEVMPEQDDKLIETLLDIKEEGIYLLDTKKHKYIIFSSIEKSYEDVNHEINDRILKIKFNTGTSLEPKQIVYEILSFSTDIYDTLQLEQNGNESAAFNTIIAK